MKMLSSVLFASMMCVGMVGCNQPNRNGDMNGAAIMLEPGHATIRTGESVRISAQAINLNASKLKWDVSPTTSAASITPEKDSGLSALFTASEPATYIVTASAQQPNGQWVSKDATITVNGMARPK